MTHQTFSSSEQAIEDAIRDYEDNMTSLDEEALQSYDEEQS